MNNNKEYNNIDELIDDLNICIEWAEGNEWESPIILQDVLKECKELIVGAYRIIAPFAFDKEDKNFDDKYGDE